ncbi:hypothetical protein C364_06903 [Cryptococcus neoformans Bt63]|nr:hypothetical protein C364_06903 [Cryptococcus neoformans var. grubii Bt63]
MLSLTPSSSQQESIRTPLAQSASLPPSFAMSGQSERPDSEEVKLRRSLDTTPSSPSVSASVSATASSPRSLPDTRGISMKEDGEEKDVDKLLKKVELEKKMHQLQQRLELASVKTSNGWTDLTMKEIETKLPSTPFQSRKAHLNVNTRSPMGNNSANPVIPYEPPSPSRPWQLIDVLWQPLPPPSHGMYPTSPTSPMKRARTDDHPEAPRPNGGSHAYPVALSSPGGNRTAGPGHRRASSSLSGQTLDKRMMTAGPSSPLRYGFEHKERKKRSQSQSTYYRDRVPTEETTSQDVDAAKALTSMLGGGSEDGGSMSRGSSNSLLPAAETNSLPLPESFANSAPLSPTMSSRRLSQQTTPRSTVARTPSSHARSNLLRNSGVSNDDKRPEEDQNAAELMMFLAHSPSPLKSAGKSVPVESADLPAKPSFGTAARVLFAEEDKVKPPLHFTLGSSLPSSSHGKSHSRTSSYSHSNLALAPPITPDNKEADSSRVGNGIQ